MRVLKVFLLLILLFETPSLIAQTQAEMTMQAEQKLKSAEAELASLYNQILTDYSFDKVFIKNIEEAQQLWTKFAAAELKARYPDREPGYYGSAHQMCLSEFRAELIVERIRRLRLWLTGVEEGDVCSGSVKTKQ